MKKGWSILVPISLSVFMIGCGSSSSSSPASGIDINVSQSALESAGWSVCHSELYGQSGTVITDILSACSGENLMLACRAVGESDFLVAAYAPKTDVTYDTGIDYSTTHSTGSVEWYYNDSYSWGFAKGGDDVYKNSCDINSTDAEYRMCLHTNSGNLSGGYRCGTVTNLNSSSDYERVFLTR